MVNSLKMTIPTHRHTELIAITSKISESLRKFDLRTGIVHIFVLHTTCGLTINENADPAVCHDLLARLEKLAPWEIPSDKHLEGNSAAHLKSSLLGSSVSVPVKDGQLVLGTWQGIFLGEFDGPRTRAIQVTAINTID